MPPRAFIATIALLAPFAASFAATGEGEQAPAPPQFLPAARSVSNWRAQAGGHLDLPPERAQALAGPQRPLLPDNRGRRGSARLGGGRRRGAGREHPQGRAVGNLDP